MDPDPNWAKIVFGSTTQHRQRLCMFLTHLGKTQKVHQKQTVHKTVFAYSFGANLKRFNNLVKLSL